MRPTLALAAWPLVIVPATAAAAEDPLAPITVEGHTLVAKMPGETEITVSPDGQRILVGIDKPVATASSHDEQHFSINGGQNFKPSMLAADEPGLANHRDPTLARGGSGDFYFAAMGHHTNIVLGRSTDGGATLTPVGNSAGDCNAFFLEPDCEVDQPHLAADRRKVEPVDQLYVVWRGRRRQDDKSVGPYTGVIECSSDRGVTWSPPRAIWTREKGDFPRVTVDAKGRVWVVMVESSRTGGGIHVQRFSSCVDGLQPAFEASGQSAPVKATDFDGDFCSSDHTIAGLDRCNDGNIIASPTIAVDETDSDRVFVTWAQRTSASDAQILTVADERAGKGGFPLRTRVDLDAGSAARFLPFSCAAGGQVLVGWYDRRRARGAGATNDTTDYFVGGVGIRDASLLHVPDVRVTPFSDAQCQTWPVPARDPGPAEACTRQPQLAGVKDGQPCDFDTNGCETGSGAPKYGDYNGIACNDEGAFLTWASHVPPAKDAKGNPPLPGEVSVFFARAGLDTARAAKLARGDAFVYQLSNDGKIEKPLEQEKLAEGISAAAPFSIGFDNFLFLLNTGSPGLKVRRAELSGTIGEQVDSKDLSAGWTSVATYGVLGFTYVFMYKEGTGFVKVRNISAGGVVAPSSSSPSQSRESGWTSVSHYAVGLDNFLLFVNANTGAMRVRRVTADGLSGQSIQSATWTRGYTTVRPFTAGGHNFLFKLKAGNGTMHVEKINDDGTTGSIVDNQTLDTGFKVAIPYNVAGGTFVLLLKPDTGSLQIRRIGDDGRLGAVTDQREFTTGWTTAAIYTVLLGKYLILIKP